MKPYFSFLNAPFNCSEVFRLISKSNLYPYGEKTLVFRQPLFLIN